MFSSKQGRGRKHCSHLYRDDVIISYGVNKGKILLFVSGFYSTKLHRRYHTALSHSDNIVFHYNNTTDLLNNGKLHLLSIYSERHFIKTNSGESSFFLIIITFITFNSFLRLSVIFVICATHVNLSLKPHS